MLSIILPDEQLLQQKVSYHFVWPETGKAVTITI